MIEHLIARYGEISLKGRNRSDFVRILVRNMRRALVQWPQVGLERTDGRVMVSLKGAPVDDVMTALARVFGILSLSPVRVVDRTSEAMAETAVLVLDDYLATAAVHRPGSAREGVHTFKIEARRVDKRYPVKSPDIARQTGEAVLTQRPDWKVDVHHPDVTVFVEVRDQASFVYGSKFRAVGGLPVGSGGKVGLLLSGGIDSPVAGWLSMKRGVELEAIHFQSFPFTSERALEKVEHLAQVLANWGGRVHIHEVYFTEVQTAIRKHCPEELGITIMRRMMFRIATEIAKQRRLLALVTGESLGQVASQTLESLRVINDVTNLPVLRPLIAQDKIDIMQMAREIGTYDISIQPYEDCCTVFIPRSPRTKPQLVEAEDAERDLPIEDLIRVALEKTVVKTFQAAEQGVRQV